MRMGLRGLRLQWNAVYGKLEQLTVCGCVENRQIPGRETGQKRKKYVGVDTKSSVQDNKFKLVSGTFISLHTPALVFRTDQCRSYLVISITTSLSCRRRRYWSPHHTRKGTAPPQGIEIRSHRDMGRDLMTCHTTVPLLNTRHKDIKKGARPQGM